MLAPALALTLAACGGDGSSEDEDQIVEAIQASARSTDPAECTELQTQQFVEQTTFSVGEEAIASCEENAPDPTGDPESVEVSDVSVDGESATATASFTGGNFDGSTTEIALIKEDEQWKLDRVTDIPTLNLGQVQDAIARQVANEPGIPPQLGTCIVEQLSATTEDEMKQIMLAGTEEALAPLIDPCVARG